MAKTDKRIDTYIANAAPFAQPIMNHLRKLVHKACPGVEETTKWSFPHFMYADEILCSMASFKQHMAFGFWKSALLTDPHKVLHATGETSMGHFGKITSKDDLPDDKIIVAYIREAMKLNEDKVKVPARTKKSGVKKELVIPAYFTAALSKNKKAQKAFEAFAYSHKKEYLEWVTEAKTEETRLKRLKTTIEWLSEGKSRNWKYEKC